MKSSGRLRNVLREYTEHELDRPLVTTEKLGKTELSNSCLLRLETAVGSLTASGYSPTGAWPLTLYMPM